MRVILYEKFGDDAKRYWLKDDRYKNRGEDIDKTIERYKWLRDEKYLDDDIVGKDISNWVGSDFESFKGYVIKMDKKVPRGRFAKEEDYTKVFENSKCEIYEIRTHEASCKLGSVDWCTSNNSDMYWIEHVKENREQIYIFRSKILPRHDQFYRIAIIVKKDGSREYRDAFNGIIEERYIQKVIEGKHGAPLYKRGMYRTRREVEGDR